ncbi:MAG TPA: hypothetical protein DEP35_05015 [Deltaproteobacteria bacterium]|nr:hypothetical protein [Deltaproteobacteria bacterium]
MARSCRLVLALVVLGLAAPPPSKSALRQDTGTVGPPFREGETITFEQIQKIQPYVPPEFWNQREFFFFDGMKLEIGPFFRDYSPAQPYHEATRRFAGQARIGPDGSLENYTAGQPFPIDQIDCKGDPQAGEKVIWDFDYRWNGDGERAHYLYTYWDRGEKLALYYEGTSKSIQMAHRVEPQYLSQEGDLFPGDLRKTVTGIEVTDPFDARGTALITNRYKSSDGPLASARNDDTWVYVPTLRRVRRISTAQRTDAISGTDFTFDDLFSFSGIIPQYRWQCLGRVDVLAPMNSTQKGYPYSDDHNFGPYGLSYANDRWELRHAIKIKMIPKNPDHPYHHKILYLDAQTLEPLYSFAYDRNQELWKIIWHNHRWSEDGDAADPHYYPGWTGVADPRDVKVVSDTIVNVQTGTGNRIEFWDNNGTPFANKGQVRRYIDVGRLTMGH